MRNPPLWNAIFPEIVQFSSDIDTISEMLIAPPLMNALLNAKVDADIFRTVETILP